MSRWIKLYSKISDWEWSDSPKHIAVLLHIFIKANYKKGTYRGVEILPGQLTTSYSALSVKSGVSIRGIRTVLRDFVTTNVVTCENMRNFSLITITNWDKYQGSDTQSDFQTVCQTSSQTTTSKNNRNIDNNIIRENSEKNKPEKKKPKKQTELIDLKRFDTGDEEVNKWISAVTKKTSENWAESYAMAEILREIRNAHFYYLEKKGKLGKPGLTLSKWFSNAVGYGKMEDLKIKEEEEKIFHNKLLALRKRKFGK